jgi:hypothetical protein
MTNAIPAHPEEPDTSRTTRELMAMPAPLPSPPTTCVIERTVTIRR